MKRWSLYWPFPKGWWPFGGEIILDSIDFMPLSMEAGIEELEVSSEVTGMVTVLTRFIGDTNVRMAIRTPSGEEFYGFPVIQSDGTAHSLFLEGEETPVDIPAGSQVIVGYPYLSRIITMRQDGMDTEGVIKKGATLHLRVLDSGNLHLRSSRDPTFDCEIEVPTVEGTLDNERDYPYTGTLRAGNPSPLGPDHFVILESSGHEPACVQVIAPDYEVGDGL
jgi:hypothetical protein